MNKDDVENPAVFGSFQFFRFCWSLCGTFGGDGKHSVGEACVFEISNWCIAVAPTSKVSLNTCGVTTMVGFPDNDVKYTSSIAISLV